MFFKVFVPEKLFGRLNLDTQYSDNFGMEPFFPDAKFWGGKFLASQ